MLVARGCPGCAREAQAVVRKHLERTCCWFVMADDDEDVDAINEAISGWVRAATTFHTDVSWTH